MADYDGLKPQNGTADYVTQIPAFYDAVETDVTNLETRATNIETKTDHIVVTQAVNLDTMETDTVNSKAKTDFISVTQPVDLDNIETDTSNNTTKLSGIEVGATADQTGSEIKIAYEAEADTNAFTDANVTKLSGIEVGATADQTKIDIDSLGINAATVAGIIPKQLNILNDAYSIHVEPGNIVGSGSSAWEILSCTAAGVPANSTVILKVHIQARASSTALTTFRLHQYHRIAGSSTNQNSWSAASGHFSYHTEALNYANNFNLAVVNVDANGEFEISWDWDTSGSVSSFNFGTYVLGWYV